MSDLNSIRGTETAGPLIVRLARVKQPLVPDLVELLVDIVILIEFCTDVLPVIVNQDFLSERPDRTLTVVAIRYFLSRICIILLFSCTLALFVFAERLTRISGATFYIMRKG
jgi:hypothetical protein